MTDSNAKNGDTKSPSSRLSLPALPGAEAFQHQTTAWGEQAVDLLTQAQLIQSANGEESPAVSSLIDTPLDMLPELPLEHPRYETRRSERLKVSIANERNRLDRLRIIYAEWDTIYSALALAAKDNCPILARDLRRKCDLTSQGVLGGHFNGPLAWRMVLQHLFGQERTRYDKAFYRNAELSQRTNKLPAGCSGDAFGKKALAFVEHIRPHLAQQYTDEDASEYIMDLLPKELKTEAGRQQLRNICLKVSGLVDAKRRGL